MISFLRKLFGKRPPLRPPVDTDALKNAFTAKYSSALANLRWVCVCLTNYNDTFRLSVGLANAAELARAKEMFPLYFPFEGREYPVTLYNYYPND